MLIIWQILRRKTAEAKRTIIVSKRRSWQNYVSELTADVPISRLWQKIKAFQGRYPVQTYQITENGKLVEDNIKKAELFVNYFSGISNVASVTNQINTQDAINQAMKCEDVEEYNSPFTSGELDRILKNLKLSSCGRDEIHNIFLKNLPLHTKDKLLYLFNTSWITGEIPHSWKLSTTIPLLKPGKDRQAIQSYRPISLLSCIGKLMERMVKARLEWIIESKKLS